MTRQWTVKVDGNNVKTLHDGESVEIGRKPLRPLSDDIYRDRFHTLWDHGDQKHYCTKQ